MPYPTPDQRYRSAERRAQHERDEGIPDRLPLVDPRKAFPMLLACVGWRDVMIEPREGYIAWRCVDRDTGEVLHCAALKELLRWVARQLPRWVAARNYQ